MKQVNTSPVQVTRRHWLVLAGTALAGCGGGGGGNLVAGLPGTGGTGSPVFAQGSISGFGSVIVNGIKFDDIGASVLMDGSPATSADLRLGMVAEVQGARGADLTLGTASSIGVWTIAQGIVSAPGATGFKVSGMTIQTNSNTVFEGVSGAGQLVDGKTVAVWGLLAGSDGTQWAAARVEVLTSATQVVVSGVVSVSGAQRSVNGMVLTGSKASELVAGAFVRVQGVLTAGCLAVSAVRSLSAASVVQAAGDAEIEGYVTAIASTSRFTLGTFQVDASSASYTPLGVVITLGAKVEIHGSWIGGVLKAAKISVEDEETPNQTEISGTITTFTSLSDFVLRGQRCDASAATFSHGTAINLKAGAKVQVTGKLNGDVLVVATLEFDD